MALPKFSELLFQINNPGVATNKDVEQVDETSKMVKSMKKPIMAEEDVEQVDELSKAYLRMKKYKRKM